MFANEVNLYNSALGYGVISSGSTAADIYMTNSRNFDLNNVSGVTGCYGLQIYPLVSGNTMMNAVQINSGATNNSTSISMSRSTVTEVHLGLVGRNNDYLSGTIPGDLVLSNTNSSNNIFFGNNSTTTGYMNNNGLNISNSITSSNLIIRSTSNTTYIPAGQSADLCSNGYLLGSLNNGVTGATFNLMGISGSGFRYGCMIYGTINLEAGTQGVGPPYDGIQTIMIKFYACYSNSTYTGGTLSNVTINNSNIISSGSSNGVGFSMAWSGTTLQLITTTTAPSSFPSYFIYTAPMKIMVNQNNTYLYNRGEPITNVNIITYNQY